MIHNILHFISLLGIVVVIFLHTDLKSKYNDLNSSVNSLPDYKDYTERAKYVNVILHNLEYRYDDLHALATAAYDMASNKTTHDFDWTVGLTTEQIDSITEYDLN